MNILIKKIKAFEERNNISITVLLHGDGSSNIREFWNEEELNDSDSIKELYNFLNQTKYQLDEEGRCISPVKIKVPTHL